jgi:hypothetical protein
LLISTLATLSFALQSQVQQSKATRDTVRPVVVATRASEHPSIDGKLTEPAWANAQPVARFTQTQPRDGAAPSERTEVRVLYDADAIYIGARMYDSNARSVMSRLGRRDAETNSDAFIVAIDSYHDHRTAFQLQVNAAGVKSDGVASDDLSFADLSWDPVWDAATQIDDAGWTAEIRIPFSQLRFSGSSAQTWGMNFERYLLRTDERMRWAWTPNSEAGYASLFGHVEGLRDVGGTRLGRLELMPYAVQQQDNESGIDAVNPFHLGRRYRTTVGADFKYGVSAGLTLTGTVNPDFGQVEADPAEVNLTVFETYFQERRPFFVEGANLFTFPSAVFAAPQLFYSRRIGRPPSGPVPSDAQFIDRPEVTSILGAAKLSGKIGRWSLGVVNATTSRERADYSVTTPGIRAATVEPAANYSVVSLQRDFRHGASGLGFLGTSVYRRIDTSSLKFLRSGAQAGGFDFFHRFGRNQYSINGTIGASSIQGDSVAIINAQRSSVRYYQRPDQDYVSLNPHARSLEGYNVSLSGGKVAGTWLIGSDFYASSPGFEINDVGFQQAADRIFHGIRATHRWLQPTKLFRSSQVYTNVSNQWNYGGSLLSSGFYFGGFGQLHNYWSVQLNGVLSRGVLSDRITRGGPLEVIPRQWSANTFISSDQRKSVSGSVFANVTRNKSGGYGNSANLQLSVRPTSALSLSFSPTYNETHSAAGYVAAPLDPQASAMYGRRYIVADLLQKTLDLTTRMDMALTPRLSVQFYTQPFTSSVAYSGYKAFVRPQAFEFLVYGQNGSTIAYDDTRRQFRVDADGAGPAPTHVFGNPDFRLRSLRGNFVIRWEYRPGSLLYFAWAHGREGFDADPSFDAARDLRDLAHDDHRSRLLVKASYWINP